MNKYERRGGSLTQAREGLALVQRDIPVRTFAGYDVVGAVGHLMTPSRHQLQCALVKSDVGLVRRTGKAQQGAASRDSCGGRCVRVGSDTGEDALRTNQVQIAAKRGQRAR